MTRVIGIDPGASGGIVVIHSTGEIDKYKMPNTQHGIWELFENGWPGEYNPATACDDIELAVLEKISPGFPGSGKSQMAKLYGNYRELRMCLVAVGARFEEVTAGAWQKGLKIKGKAKTESRTDWKNRLKAEAQRLRPDVQWTHWNADAFLLAEYGRKVLL